MTVSSLSCAAGHTLRLNRRGRALRRVEVPRNLEDTMLGLLVMVIGIAVMAPIAPRAHAGVLWLIGGAVMTAAMILI
jgi:hypothetical protein